MTRSRRRETGVGVASWGFLLSIWTEIAASTTGYVGTAGGGCTKVARDVAVASCSRTSRRPKAAVLSSLLKTSYGGSRSWRHGDDHYPFMGRLLENRSVVYDAAGTVEMNCSKEFGSPRPPFTCLRAVADSSGGSDSGYGLAPASTPEETASGATEPAANILQRLSMAAFERSAAAIPRPTTPSTQTNLSVPPSDPIKRFSSDCRIGDNKAVGNNRAFSESTASTSLDNVFNDFGSSTAKRLAAGAGGRPTSSVADRLAAVLRPRTILSGQLHRGIRNQSGQRELPRGIDHGVQQLNAVIARVEAKLNFDSSEAGELRVRSNHPVVSRVYQLRRPRKMTMLGADRCNLQFPCCSLFPQLATLQVYHGVRC